MTKPIDVYKCVVAGVATKKGVTKVRFARDMVRVKGLVKDGQTGVELVELPEPMSKGDAVKYLLTQPQFAGSARESVEAADAKYNGAKTVKVSGVKVKVSAKTKAKTKTKAKAPAVVAPVTNTAVTE